MGRGPPGVAPPYCVKNDRHATNCQATSDLCLRISNLRRFRQLCGPRRQEFLLSPNAAPPPWVQLLRVLICRHSAKAAIEASMCLKWPLFASAKSLQPVYNWKACYLPTLKTVESISAVPYRSYGRAGNGAQVSMTNSRRRGPTTLSSCRPFSCTPSSEFVLPFYGLVADLSGMQKNRTSLRPVDDVAPQPFSMVSLTNLAETPPKLTVVFGL